MPEPAKPASAAPAVGPGASGAWFYARNKQKLGPFSWEQFRTLASTGQLKPDDMVFQQGTQRWLAASAVPGLFPPPPSAPPPAPPPANSTPLRRQDDVLTGLSAPAPASAQRAVSPWLLVLLAFLLGIGATIAFSPYFHRSEEAVPISTPQAEEVKNPTPRLPERDPQQELDRQLARVAVVWRDNPGQALELLNNPAACPPLLRDATWHDYEQLCRFDRSRLAQSHGEVTALAMTPDARQLASGGADRTVLVWNVRTGQARHVLRGHKAAVTALAWRADGLRLLSGDRDGQLKYWDLQRGEERKEFFHPSDLLESMDTGATIIALALTSDGGTAAVARQHAPQAPTSGGRRVELWDAHKGRLRSVLRDIAGPLAFSPDGRMLAIGEQLWDADSGTPRVTRRPFQGEVRAVAFTPDGAALALGVEAGQRNGLRILDAQIWDLTGAGSSPQ
jgi:hypothetical protein